LDSLQAKLGGILIKMTTTKNTLLTRLTYAFDDVLGDYRTQDKYREKYGGLLVEASNAVDKGRWTQDRSEIEQSQEQLKKL
jgi:hypothetical protein